MRAWRGRLGEEERAGQQQCGCEKYYLSFL